MNKLCCCIEPDLPDITVNFKCACCKSRLEETKARDTTDFEMAVSDHHEITESKTEKEEKEEDDEETTTCCCCFRRKRQAKSNKKGKGSKDGRKT